MAAAIVNALVRRSASSNSTTSISCCFGYLFPSKSHHFYFSTASDFKPPAHLSPPFTPDFFIQKYHFSPDIASELASVSARLRKPQNPDLLLSFLKQTGFSNAHLDRIVKHHTQLLSLCVETNVKPKFKILHDLGFSAEEAAEVVARDFTILYHASNSTRRTLSVLKGVLGSNENVIKLIKKRPSVFYANPEKTLLPNIEFLKSCGVHIQQIDSCIYTSSNLLFVSPENVSRSVHKADEMGVLRSSRMFIHAVQTVSRMSDEALELKLQSFRDLGFSEDDILRVFGTAPVVISVSTKKIKEVIEVLLQTGKYNMLCIIKSPESLMFSVEKRYKPRLQVLEVLERKGLITNWPSLATLCSMSNKSFVERFVALDINELGDAFTAKTAAST